MKLSTDFRGLMSFIEYVKWRMCKVYIGNKCFEINHDEESLREFISECLNLDEINFKYTYSFSRDIKDSEVDDFIGRFDNDETYIFKINNKPYIVFNNKKGLDKVKDALHKYFEENYSLSLKWELLQSPDKEQEFDQYLLS